MIKYQTTDVEVFFETVRMKLCFFSQCDENLLVSRRTQIDNDIKVHLVQKFGCVKFRPKSYAKQSFIDDHDHMISVFVLREIDEEHLYIKARLNRSSSGTKVHIISIEFEMP